MSFDIFSCALSCCCCCVPPFLPWGFLRHWGGRWTLRRSDAVPLKNLCVYAQCGKSKTVKVTFTFQEIFGRKTVTSCPLARLQILVKQGKTKVRGPSGKASPSHPMHLNIPIRLLLCASRPLARVDARSAYNAGVTGLNAHKTQETGRNVNPAWSRTCIRRCIR